jgi:signal transduction histidine kinase/CheY-like chemotaxis protein
MKLTRALKGINLGCILLTALIFTIDLHIPLGVAGGVPYLAVVLLTSLEKEHNTTIFFAIVGSALTVLGYALSPEGGEQWKVFLNRFIAFFAIWSTALMVLLWKRSEQQILVAKMQAEEANTAKSEFLSCMSHELRTPLNAVMGFAQLLQMDDDLNEDQRSSANEIYHASELLLSLINDIMDLSKIEAGKMTLSIEPVALAEVLDQICYLSTPLANQSHITLNADYEIGPDLFVRADSVRLKQVLLNLVSNAIKYNRENGKVRVSIAKNVVTQNVRIIVSDTGMGISAEKLNQLFLPFDRLGAELSNTPGSGIGLVISKSLIEMMGGQIGVESTLGKGSRFWIELDCVMEKDTYQSLAIVSDAVKLMSSQTAMHYDTETRILLAEDNSNNSTFLKQYFTELGFKHVDSVKDGQTAWVKLQQQRYDILFTDIQMPHLDGIELINKIRQLTHDRHNPMPIIVISASGKAEQVREYLMAGATDFIAKPADLNRIKEVLDQRLVKRT